METNAHIDQLESELYRFLGIPVEYLPPQDGGRCPVLAGDLGTADRGSSSKVERIDRLRQAISALREDAARIGSTPVGYPKHISLVIRTISALLPWYTRTLVQFGRQTVDTCQRIADELHEVRARQDAITGELEKLRATLVSRAEAKPSADDTGDAMM